MGFSHLRIALVRTILLLRQLMDILLTVGGEQLLVHVSF